MDGFADGDRLEGFAVGFLLGALVEGTVLGVEDGLREGCRVGTEDGFAVGTAEIGEQDGFTVGDTEGSLLEGLADGALVAGFADGLLLGRRVGLIVLGNIVGNEPLVNAGDNADAKYGTIAFAPLKSLFNTPTLSIPTAQLMPFWPGSRLLILSRTNSPFMYLIRVFSH